MQGLAPNPHFSQEVVRSLGVMACCSDCSSIHTLDCSDYSYSGYYATLSLDFDSDSCFPHTVLVAVADSDRTSTRTGPALLFVVLTGILCYCAALHRIHITPMG